MYIIYLFWYLLSRSSSLGICVVCTLLHCRLLTLTIVVPWALDDRSHRCSAIRSGLKITISSLSSCCFSISSSSFSTSFCYFTIFSVIFVFFASISWALLLSGLMLFFISIHSLHSFLFAHHRRPRAKQRASERTLELRGSDSDVKHEEGFCQRMF